MQKRTSKNKKFVYFNNIYVIKGPYKVEDKAFWNALYYPLLIFLVEKFTMKLRNYSAYSP